MTAVVLNGREIAAEITDQLATEVEQFTARSGVVPKLAAVLVGDDPASQVYVRNKQKACERARIDSQLHRLPTQTREEELLQLVRQLNDDAQTHGILIQTPLPAGINTSRVLDAVNPWKDVDAFHPENVGLIVQGRPRFLPCTPHGIQQILHHAQVSTSGKHVVIIGRSDIVGKPLALMLMQRSSAFGPDAANATVTVCHSRTHDLPAVTRSADILVAAIGVPRFVSREMVRPGAVVIDVGINRTDDGLVGDVDFEPVCDVASHITPVPRGVGPMTIAKLLENTLTAARIAQQNR